MSWSFPMAFFIRERMGEVVVGGGVGGGGGGDGAGVVRGGLGCWKNIWEGSTSMLRVFVINNIWKMAVIAMRPTRIKTAPWSNDLCQSHRRAISSRRQPPEQEL